MNIDHLSFREHAPAAALTLAPNARRERPERTGILSRSELRRIIAELLD